jgi:hypothetical protein
VSAPDEPVRPAAAAPAAAAEPDPLSERMPTADHFAAAVYGSILVTALVAALDHEHATKGALVGGVAATVGVFWLAHVWSGLVGQRAVEGGKFDWGAIRHIAAEEWPMIEAALLPLAALLLAWAGLWSTEVGIDIALGIGIAHLIGWGVVVGRRAYGTWFAAALTGIVDGALGIGIVVLETAIH